MAHVFIIQQPMFWEVTRSEKPEPRFGMTVLRTGLRTLEEAQEFASSVKAPEDEISTHKVQGYGNLIKIASKIAAKSGEVLLEASPDAFLLTVNYGGETQKGKEREIATKVGEIIGDFLWQFDNNIHKAASDHCILRVWPKDFPHMIRGEAEEKKLQSVIEGYLI